MTWLSFSILACMGCGMFDAHIKEFDLMRGMAADAAMRLQDGSIGQMQVSGQGLNPGIVVEAAIVYRAVARYDGLAGQFGVSGQGAFGRPVDMDQVWAVINDASLSERERRAILENLLNKVIPDATTRPTP